MRQGSFQWRPRATASHSPQMPLTPFRPALFVDAHNIQPPPNQLADPLLSQYVLSHESHLIATLRNHHPRSPALPATAFPTNHATTSVLHFPSTPTQSHCTPTPQRLASLSSPPLVDCTHYISRPKSHSSSWLIRNHHSAPIAISSHRNSSLLPTARLSTLELTAACLPR